MKGLLRSELAALRELLLARRSGDDQMVVVCYPAGGKGPNNDPVTLPPGIHRDPEGGRGYVIVFDSIEQRDRLADELVRRTGQITPPMLISVFADPIDPAAEFPTRDPLATR